VTSLLDRADKDGGTINAVIGRLQRFSRPFGSVELESAALMVPPSLSARSSSEVTPSKS